MKRSPSLRDLSVDHHHALVQGHRLVRAASADDATLRRFSAEFLEFWRNDGQRHFCEEEQVLLPFFARYGEIEQEPIHQMLREHTIIRRDAALLAENGAGDGQLCRRLGEQLTAHVRLEERIVFPLIEETLPDEALKELEIRLLAFHDEADGDKEKTMPNATQSTLANPPKSTLPGENLQTHKMPGHWLLARLGKKVLRPGGLELTRQLLEALKIQAGDHVVEFAPGMGVTAQMTLEKHPALYIAVERDEDAAASLRAKLNGPNREFRTGSADETGLPDECASVVYGEAMLTMQTPSQKARVVGEAARLLKSGGRYGIHELCFAPDDLDEATEREITQALSGSIHVGARPLRARQWRELLENEGLEVQAEYSVPMALLEPQRLIADEGLDGALRIVWNALHDEEALARARDARCVWPLPRASQRHRAGGREKGLRLQP